MPQDDVREYFNRLLGRDQPDRRKEGSDAAWIAREQRQVRDVGVSANEKIRQWTCFLPARAWVLSESLTGLKSCIERQGQTGEGGEPMFKLLLRVEFDRQFGEDDQVVADRALIRPRFELPARPFEPVGVSG